MVVRTLPLEQPRDHRILRARELDHDRRVEVAKPVDERGDRDVSPDRDVVDQREAEDEVGAPAVEKRSALDPAPAEAG